jgi:hypothetical protein
VSARKAARPGASSKRARGPRGVLAGELRDREAKSDRAPLSMLGVYDGRVCIGFLILRGPAGVEAFDVNNRSLGIFPDQAASADAVTRAVS